jgi:hypothetical protein
VISRFSWLEQVLFFICIISQSRNPISCANMIGNASRIRYSLYSGIAHGIDLPDVHQAAPAISMPSFFKRAARVVRMKSLRDIRRSDAALSNASAKRTWGSSPAPDNRTLRVRASWVHHRFKGSVGTRAAKA